MSLIRPAWLKLNRLRTGAGSLQSSMYKQGFAPSATCKCGADDQTAGHVFLHCNIQRVLAGICGLMFLDEDTTPWLLDSCSDIKSRAERPTL